MSELHTSRRGSSRRKERERDGKERKAFSHSVPPHGAETDSPASSPPASQRARSDSDAPAAVPGDHKDIDVIAATVREEVELLLGQQKRLEGLLEHLQEISSPSLKPPIPVPERLNKKAKYLKETIRHLKVEKEELTRKVVEIGEVVSLNVGGVIYWTSLTTLRKYRGTMLYSMFAGRHTLVKDSNGHYFLDRNGRMFNYVLSFLRNSRLPLMSLEDLHELRLEADFFSIQPLLKLVDTRLQEYTSRQFAVLRYNENSNYNNLSWQGITRPVLLTMGTGSLYKSIDQVLAEVDTSGWELAHMSGDGSAEGGWMYVFRKKSQLFLEAVDTPCVKDGSSSGDHGSPRPAMNDDPLTSKSVGIVLEKSRIKRKHSGSF